LSNRNYKNYVTQKAKKNKKVAKYYHKYHKFTLKESNKLFNGNLKFDKKSYDRIESDTKNIIKANRKLKPRYLKMLRAKISPKYDPDKRFKKVMKFYNTKYSKLINKKLNMTSFVNRISGKSMNSNIISSFERNGNDLDAISKSLSEPINQSESIRIDLKKDEIINRIVSTKSMMKRKFKVNTILKKNVNLFNVISNRYKEKMFFLDQRSIRNSYKDETKTVILDGIQDSSKRFLFD